MRDNAGDLKSFRSWSFQGLRTKDRTQWRDKIGGKDSLVSQSSLRSSFVCIQITAHNTRHTFHNRNIITQRLLYWPAAEVSKSLSLSLLYSLVLYNNNQIKHYYTSMHSNTCQCTTLHTKSLSPRASPMEGVDRQFFLQITLRYSICSHTSSCTFGWGKSFKKNPRKRKMNSILFINLIYMQLHRNLAWI